VAGGSTDTHTTTTVFQSSRGAVLPASLSASKGLSVSQIYRQAGPGVVDITVTQNSSGGGFGPFGGSEQTQGEGAGVVYDTKGDILTDEHVVAGATSVKVTFENGKKVSAKVLGHRPVDGRRGDPRRRAVGPASPDPVRRLRDRPGGRSGDRDRQPVQPS